VIQAKVFYFMSHEQSLASLNIYNSLFPDLGLFVFVLGDLGDLGDLDTLGDLDALGDLGALVDSSALGDLGDSALDRLRTEVPEFNPVAGCLTSGLTPPDPLVLFGLRL